MSQDNSLQHINSDSPIQSRDADLLKRGLFAERLARALLNFKGNDSIVLSLEGSWGSGKTSIFNLMKEHIESIENDSKPILIIFNPWWFSNKDDLAFKFFDQMSANLPSSQNEAWQTIAKGIQTIGKVLKHIPSIETVGGLVEGVGGTLNQGVSLSKLKGQLSDSLIENNIHLWVFIDDIDRLFPDEVLQMLSLIRGVGDISNVKYILAYDRVELKKRIGKALGDLTEEQTSDYIDKIVQVTFPIPNTAIWHIWEMLVDGLIKTLGDEKVFDEFNTDFRQLWGLSESLLKTPRDVKRLLNSFSLSFFSAEEKLHAIDFLGLEILRMYFPEIYTELSRNKDLLLGAVSGLYYKREDRTEDINRILALVKNSNARDSAQGLLEWLFPELQNLRREQRLFSEKSDEWNIQKRICSEDYFDAYFQLSIPPETLSQIEIEQLIDCLSDANKLSNLLLSKNQKVSQGNNIPRSMLLVEELRRRVKNIRDLKMALTIVTGLLQIGDEVAKNSISLFFHRDFAYFLGKILLDVVGKFGSDNVIDVLNQSFSSSPSLHSVLVAYGNLFHKGQSKNEDQTSNLLTSEQLKVLQETLKQRVEKIDIGKVDVHNPLLIRTLYNLKLVTGSFDKSKELVAQLISSPEGMLAFMRTASSEVQTSTMNERGGVSYQKFQADKRIIEQFTNTDEFVKNLSKIAETSSEAQQKEIQEYLESLGKSEPDS